MDSNLSQISKASTHSAAEFDRISRLPDSHPMNCFETGRRSNEYLAISPGVLGIRHEDPTERHDRKGEQRLARGLRCLVLRATEASLTEILIQLILRRSSDINGDAKVEPPRL
jgi:hypothetical protein